MRWVSHKTVTAGIVYAVTGDLTATCAATVGSIVPDLLEFPFGSLLRHRGVTHYWPLYALPFVGFNLASVYYQNFELFYVSMFFMGALLHWFEDGLSKSGVSLWPFRGRFAANWYKTFTVSEFVTTAVLVAASVTYCWYAGYFKQAYVRGETERLVVIAQIMFHKVLR